MLIATTRPFRVKAPEAFEEEMYNSLASVVSFWLFPYFWS